MTTSAHLQVYLNIKTMKKKILVADEDESIRTVISRALSRSGYHVRSTQSATDLWSWVSNGEGDLLITDAAMPNSNGLDLLLQINQVRPEFPVIVMSAKSAFLSTTTVNQHKDLDYLAKPFDLDELLALVDKAVAPKQITSSNMDALERKGKEEWPLVGSSPGMQQIYRSLARLSNSDLTVMISGEYGTGKQLLAKTLHDYGKRHDNSFVTINIATTPPDLIQSELFGQERNASTVGNKQTLGRFELAEGGTLFLDEIGDMPLQTQTRLLSVLQDGEYTAVGGGSPIKSNVRIIASTHRNLQNLVSEGLFREDLYYRLNVVPLRLSPLRERVDDIPLLLRHFFDLFEDNEAPVRSVSPDAISSLKKYDWPGNVKELENLIRRICALYPDNLITDEIIQSELMKTLPTRDKFKDRSEDGLTGTVDRHLANYFAAHNNTLPARGLHDRVLREIERPLITQTLIATKGNQIKAAEILGINRNTLRAKIRKLDIRVVRRIR